MYLLLPISFIFSYAFVWLFSVFLFSLEGLPLLFLERYYVCLQIVGPNKVLTLSRISYFFENKMTFAKRKKYIHILLFSNPPNLICFWLEWHHGVRLWDARNVVIRTRNRSKQSAWLYQFNKPAGWHCWRLIIYKTQSSGATEIKELLL